jgi:hypothetical protein
MRPVRRFSEDHQMTKDEQIKGMANPNRGSVGVQEAQPPQRTWVDLTDEQIKAIDEMALTKNIAIAMTMRTLKEKNT